MYRIIETGGAEHLSDTIVPIRVAKNGCYVRAKDDPDGFTGKIQVDTEDGQSLMDKVFVLPGKTLTGSEPEAIYREDYGMPVINELENDLAQAYELLYGGYGL